MDNLLLVLAGLFKLYMENGFPRMLLGLPSPGCSLNIDLVGVGGMSLSLMRFSRFSGEV